MLKKDDDIAMIECYEITGRMVGKSTEKKELHVRLCIKEVIKEMMAYSYTLNDHTMIQM